MGYDTADIVQYFDQFKNQGAVYESIKRGSFPEPDYCIGKKKFWKLSTLNKLTNGAFSELLEYQHNQPKTA